MANPQGRRWCFTLNNYTEEQQTLVTCIPDFFSVAYLVCAWEVAETGTPHLQGFIHFADRRRLSWLCKNIFHAHWEQAKGSDAQQRAYCCDGYVFEYGTPAGYHQQAITMDEYALMPDEEAMKFCPGRDMQWRKRKDEWRSLRYKPYEGVRSVIWLHGATGTGKSRAGYACPDISSADVSGRRFFNGARSTAALLIDEVDKVDMPLQVFLRITDRYPTTLDVKGGCIPHTASTVIFTASCTPEVCWPGNDEYLKQVERRITDCICTDVPGWDADLFFADAPLN